MSIIQGGSTAAATGKQFEIECRALLTNPQLKERVYYSENNYYKPDAVTETMVLEFKFQRVGGSAKNKLTQALFELDYMGDVLSKTPVLVYKGEILEQFTQNDPAFLRARRCCPDVLILNSETFETIAELN